MPNLRVPILPLLLALSTLATGAVTTTVVDIPTRGVTQRILYVRPDAPVANIVHWPGGDGVLFVGNDGVINSPTLTCGPFVRLRQAFADRGYGIALVDQTSDGVIRQYADMLEVVRYLRARDNVPVWVSGGSSSTGVAVAFAANLPLDTPLGLAVFSPGSFSAATAARVMRPALVISHSADSLANGSQMFNALTAALTKERVTLVGGIDGGCGGYHLFQGLDAEFVGAVAGFMDKTTPTLVGGPPPVGTAVAVEFYNAALDHYFLTHIAGEMTKLDNGTFVGWTRTGASFNVYAAAQPSSSPVCRFYIPPGKGDSHFYGRGTAECNDTAAKNPSFVNEDPQFFHMVLPTLGVCPAGTRNVYRAFSGRVDANHRYMVDPAIRDQMVAKQWIAEGDGPELVVMCSPV